MKSVLNELSAELKAYLDSAKFKVRASQALQRIRSGESMQQGEIAAALGLEWQDFCQVSARFFAANTPGMDVSIFDEFDNRVETIRARRSD